MGLEGKLRDDLHNAMRKGDKLRTSVLRMLLSAVSYAQFAKQAPMEDSDILGVVAKEAKQRLESIEAFRSGGRADLVSQEESELSILKEYLPVQLSREEIIAAARDVIASTGAKSLQDKSKVMPKLIAELKGRADGKEINTVVTELLSGK